MSWNPFTPDYMKKSVDEDHSLGIIPSGWSQKKIEEIRILNYSRRVDIDEINTRSEIMTFRHDGTHRMTGVLCWNVGWRSFEDPIPYLITKSTELGWRLKSIHLELQSISDIYVNVQYRDGHIGLSPTQNFDDLRAKSTWKITSEERFVKTFHTEMEHFEDIESMYCPILIEAGVSENVDLDWSMQTVYEFASRKGICTTLGGHTIVDGMVYGPRWGDKTKDGLVTGIDRLVSGTYMVKRPPLMEVEVMDPEVVRDLELSAVSSRFVHHDKDRGSNF